LNITAVAPVKPVPEIVTVLPPSFGPMFGATTVTFGGKVVLVVVVVVVDVVDDVVVVGDVVDELHATVILRTSAAIRRGLIAEEALRVTDPLHA
jgi:hypothetical protein